MSNRLHGDIRETVIVHHYHQNIVTDLYEDDSEARAFQKGFILLSCGCGCVIKVMDKETKHCHNCGEKYHFSATYIYKPKPKMPIKEVFYPG